ncbi:MAG: GbsR/MarR family transcriptional regulator [Marinifilaceae bacterium]
MITNNKLLEKKKELVEKFGAFMEGQEKLTPIAARIFASLFICGPKGSTFEELVLFLGASKSTISTNLQNLSNAGIVTFYTKPGDRKKYFILSSAAFLSRVEEEIVQYRTEYQIVKEIIVYKEEANNLIEKEEEKYELKNPSPYLDFLSNTITLLEQLREHVKSNCGVHSLNDKI